MSDLAVPSWRPRQEKQGSSVRMLAVAGGLLGMVALAGAPLPGRLPHGAACRAAVIEADARPLEGPAGESGRHGRAEPGPAGAGTHRGAARSRAPRRQRQAGRRARGAGSSTCCGSRQRPRRRSLPRPSSQPSACRSNAAPQAPTGAPCRPLHHAVAAPIGSTVGATPGAGCQRPRHDPARRAVDRGGRARRMAPPGEARAGTRRLPAAHQQARARGPGAAVRLRTGGSADAAAATSLCDRVKAKGAGCVPVGASFMTCGRARPSSGSPGPG